MMLITVDENTLILEAGKEVIFPHQTWDDYEQLLKIRQERVLPKLSFNAITQEIRLMSPLPSHGNRVNILGDLVKTLLNHQGKDWQGFDPITLKMPLKAGLEPDTCFYIDSREAILGKGRIDLTVDPPPDLAIEVDFTSITDIKAYELLKIPELWIYRQEILIIYIWKKEGYLDSDKSRLFPDIDVKNILPNYVELAWKQGSSIALRQFSQNLIDSTKI
ncbi:Uma2 family endonuclease [Cyanobacterium aponinum AL20118]|uniref:Uma2 family endonuclease n=1 Tax=Cyanobacterium aponinum AL20115 TaxID=3090662 RepID=A0AAF1C367_9CHRO|nr:Uma2 family endonuclease [Cyanobacterium aponinum]WPF90472.1 Uma2 family endonuclease [Cyanobacterium aponinum AL20115]